MRAVLAVLAVAAFGLTLARGVAAEAWIPIFNGQATHGMAVDRVDGAVWAVVQGQGISKSLDHGKTFTLMDGAIIKAHCETGCGISLDPEGGRIMCFMCYGDAGGSLDGGKTWFRASKGHWNWGTVDWSDAQARTLFADGHDRGELFTSPDRGETWRSLGWVGGCQVGIAPDRSLIAAGDGGIWRAENGGGFTQVSSEPVRGRAMRVLKGRCWWVGEHGMLVSADNGRTWSAWGSPVDGCLGPYFGRDEHSLLVVGAGGFMRTNDDGASWQRLATLPDFIVAGWNAPEGGAQRPYWFVQFGWDPNANILYASTLGSLIVKRELASEKDASAQADALIAQAEKASAGAARAAQLKLLLATADLPLDAAHRAKVQSLTDGAAQELSAQQQAVRSALAGDAKAFDKILAEARKAYAGTAAAAWFTDAAAVPKARQLVAGFARSGTGPIPAAAKAQARAALDGLLRTMTTDEFKRLVEAEAARITGMTSYGR